MAPRKERLGEDKNISEITNNKNRLFSLQKDNQEFKRYLPKGPPLIPKCSHVREEMECNRVSQEDVERFYNGFYQIQERIMQDTTILRHCEVQRAGCHRIRTAFFLPTNEGRTRVCKTAFAGALAIGVARIEKVLRIARQDLRQERGCHEPTISKKKVTFAKANHYRHFNTNKLKTSSLGELDSLSSSDDIFNNTFNVTSKRFSKSDLSSNKLYESLPKEHSSEVDPNSSERNKLKKLQENTNKNQVSTNVTPNKQDNFEYLTECSPRIFPNLVKRSSLETDKNQNTLENSKKLTIASDSENSKDKFADEFSGNSKKSFKSCSEVFCSTPKKSHSRKFLLYKEFTWSDPKSTPKISNNSNKINRDYQISFDWSDRKPNSKLRLNENRPMKNDSKTVSQKCISNYAEENSNLDYKNIRYKRKCLTMLTNVIHDIENLSLKDKKSPSVENKQSLTEDKENIRMQMKVCNDKSSGTILEKENEKEGGCKKHSKFPSGIVRRLGKRNNHTDRRAMEEISGSIVSKPKIVL